jgi:general secretion pathway protein L
MRLGIDLTRLGIAVGTDRLTAAVVGRTRVETFTVEADGTSAALRAELEARGVSTRSAAVGLPRAVVTVKPIDLPPVAGDLREMVRFDLERHLPFPGDDPPFDFMELPRGAAAPGADPSGARVLVAAAERRTVEGALRIAEEAGLRPTALTVGAHDLARLADLGRRQRVVWIHRSQGGIEVLFLTGRALALSRGLPASDETLLAEEITRSLRIVGWPLPDAVWVSGDVPDGAAGPEGPLGRLGAPITEPAWSRRARRLLEAHDEPLSGAALVALALAAARGIPPLDLLPHARRPRRITRPQALTAGLAGATALLLLAALLAPGYRESRRLAALDAELLRIGPQARVVEETLRELERKRRLLATIDALESGTARPLPILRDLTELLPQDSWLTTLSLEAKGMEMTGQAAAASALIPLLENSPWFERVEFASPVTRGKDREQFRVQAAWEGRGAAQVRR